TAAATENVRLKSGGRAQAAADELAAAAEKALHASKGHAASHEDPRGTVGKILDSESAGWTGERHEQQVVDVREMGLGSEAVPEG
ncbi:hypothetical protein HaLaN_30941, partial [Haematococcus lacustris]